MSFLLSFFQWTICLTQVIWSNTVIDVPVFDDLESYITIPEATLYIDGIAVADIPSYVRSGVERTFLSTVVTSHVKTYYIYFEAYFEHYNISQKQLITINVVDEIKPEMTYIPTYIIDVYGEPPDFYEHLQYKDNYDQVEDLDVEVDDRAINFNQIGTYDVIYYITDTSGNTETYVKQIKIIDRIKPQIELIKPIILDVHTLLDITTFIKITDNYDLNVNYTVIGDEVPFDRLGYHEITVLAVDKSRNQTIESFVIEIVDRTPPELILVSYPKIIPVYDIFDERDCYEYVLSVSDNYDDVDINDIRLSFDVDPNRVGKYKIYYSISDQSGNETQKTLEVEVKDLIGPNIKISESLIFEVFSAHPILNHYISVDDNYCDVSLLDIDVDSNINMNQIGIYELNITALDCFKNKTTLHTTVEIIDLIPPEITQVSEIVLTEFTKKDLSIYFNAIDLYDLDNTKMILDDSHIDYEKIGAYELIIYAYDQSNNESYYIADVLVVDIMPPVLEIDVSYLYLELNQADLDLISYIVNVDDNYTYVTIADVFITSDIDITQIGAYTCIYTILDSSLNQTTKKVNVFVIDREPPIIEGQSLYVKMYEHVDIMEGLFINDNVDVFDIYTSIDYIDTTYPGSYEITYVVVDTSGNQTTFSRMIYISENEQVFVIQDFLPMIIILLISASTLYYLYKKL